MNFEEIANFGNSERYFKIANALGTYSRQKRCFLCPLFQFKNQICKVGKFLFVDMARRGNNSCKVNNSCLVGQAKLIGCFTIAVLNMRYLQTFYKTRILYRVSSYLYIITHYWPQLPLVRFFFIFEEPRRNGQSQLHLA